MRVELQLSPPPMGGGSVQSTLDELTRYLWRLTEQLQHALGNGETGTARSNMSEAAIDARCRRMISQLLGNERIRAVERVGDFTVRRYASGAVECYGSTVALADGAGVAQFPALNYPVEFDAPPVEVVTPHGEGACQLYANSQNTESVSGVYTVRGATAEEHVSLDMILYGKSK